MEERRDTRDDVGALYCSGTVWSLKVVNGAATDIRVEPFTVAGLSGFGQDSQGNLYLMSVSGGGVYQLAG